MENVSPGTTILPSPNQYSRNRAVSPYGSHRNRQHQNSITPASDLGPSPISADVTDALLERGDSPVFHKLAGNSGANFSENGFAALVKCSERDEQLAEKVGLRLDVPLGLFRELLLRAAEAVRARLLALAGRKVAIKFSASLLLFLNVQHEAGFQNERDFAQAQARGFLRCRPKANSMKRQSMSSHKEVTTGTGSSASLLCGSPLQLVEGLLQNKQHVACLVPCRAIGLDWQTVRTILTCRSVGRAMADQDLDAARTDYFKLSQSSARRVLRFWQVRHPAANNVAELATSVPAVSRGPKIANFIQPIRIAGNVGDRSTLL